MYTVNIGVSGPGSLTGWHWGMLWGVLLELLSVIHENSYSTQLKWKKAFVIMALDTHPHFGKNWHANWLMKIDNVRSLSELLTLWHFCGLKYLREYFVHCSGIHWCENQLCNLILQRVLEGFVSANGISRSPIGISWLMKTALALPF